MRLIDKHTTEIVAEYDDILHREIELRSHWRAPLIAAAEGERMFISRLGGVCCEQNFVWARAMQRHNEDVDVILIETKGGWVFEVKYWSGEIYWDDRGWRRVQRYYQRGGVEATKEIQVGEPPDEQWIRSAAEVTRELAHTGELRSMGPYAQGVMQAAEETLAAWMQGE